MMIKIIKALPYLYACTTLEEDKEKVITLVDPDTKETKQLITPSLEEFLSFIYKTIDIQNKKSIPIEFVRFKRYDSCSNPKYDSCSNPKQVISINSIEEENKVLLKINQDLLSAINTLPKDIQGKIKYELSELNKKESKNNDKKESEEK